MTNWCLYWKFMTSLYFLSPGYTMKQVPWNMFHETFCFIELVGLHDASWSIKLLLSYHKSITFSPPNYHIQMKLLFHYVLLWFVLACINWGGRWGRRRFWVRPWISRRETYGAYHALLEELSNEDQKGYKTFFEWTWILLVNFFPWWNHTSRNMIH